MIVAAILGAYALALAVIFYGQWRGWFRPRPRLRPRLYIAGRCVDAENVTITLPTTLEPPDGVWDPRERVEITGSLTVRFEDTALLEEYRRGERRLATYLHR